MLTAFAATKPVSLSKSKINLEVGISKTLKVKKSGSIKITQKTFSSSNKKVATVTQNGKITAQKAGKATINVTVKYKKGNKVKSSTLKCNVNVSEKTSDASNVTEEVMPTLVPETMPGADNQTTATQAPTATATASPTPNPASGKEEPTPTPTPIPTPMPLRDAGLYDTQGNMIKAWNQLVDESLMEVSEDTISECSTSLTGELVIDESVTSIGEYAFLDCSGLTSISIPESVTSIGAYAFRGCNGLTSISIPESVTSIGNCAFGICSGLASISVAIGNITYNSNDNCNAIIETATNKLLVGCKNTIIPESVTSIGDSAFFGCSGLISISIPAGVTSIGDGTFLGCSGLTSISIPAEVTSIGEGAFSGCSGLTSINIPAGVTSIYEDAFSGCSGLSSISVATENTIYNSNDSCNAIIKTATNKLLVGCKNTIIPSNVTSIGRYAFYGCSGLTSISIPAGVTSIGNYAFCKCSGLVSISVATGNTTYNSDDDCNAIIETATNKLLVGCKNTKIPAGVTRIGDYAFYGCSGLTSISIPAGVASVGEYAFSGCSGLTSISIPSSVTSIDYGAFRGIPLVIYDGTATNYSNWGATAVQKSDGTKLYPLS